MAATTAGPIANDWIVDLLFLNLLTRVSFFDILLVHWKTIAQSFTVEVTNRNDA
jgi:hypothetical protein